MVTVVVTEPIDICVKEKGCGRLSGVILDTDAAVFLLLSDGYFGSRSLGYDQKSHGVPVKLRLKSKAGFSGDVPGTVTDDRERETEKQGGSGEDSEVGMEPHKDQRNCCTMRHSYLMLAVQFLKRQEAKKVFTDRSKH